FRLLPALITMLVAFVLYETLIMSPRPLLRHTFLAAALSLGYVTNFMDSFASAPANYLWHLWSLAEEEQFYLLWPVVLLFLLRRQCRPQRIVAVISLFILAIIVERT